MPTPNHDSGRTRHGFVATLAARSVAHAPRVRHDVDEFVTWCERGGCPDLAALDHRALRRYLAYLQTRGFARTDDRAQGGRRARLRPLPAAHEVS